MNQDDLVRALIQYAASGKLESRQIQPVLQKLLGAGAPPPSSGALLEALQELDGPSFQALASQVRDLRRKDALEHHELKKRSQSVPEALKASLADLPLDARIGWEIRDKSTPWIEPLLLLLADRFFFAATREKAPALGVALEKKFQSSIDAAFRNSGVWDLAPVSDLIAEVERQSAAGRVDLSAILPALKESLEQMRREAADLAARAVSSHEAPPPAGLDADVYLSKLGELHAQAQTRSERSRLLDLACLWPGEGAGQALLDLPLEPWEQERAGLILTLRFGQPTNTTWEAWLTWLRLQGGRKGIPVQGTRVIARKRPMAMLYLWYSRRPDAKPDALTALEKLVVARLEPVTMDDFVERWADFIGPDEWQALTGSPIPPPPPPIEEPPPLPVAAPPRAPVVRPATEVRPRPVVPKAPPKPSVWDVHLKPFFLENWYMVAGVAMVLVGSSLLAYYTWDKHWLIRYTLMPALLGAFTMALAWMGGWIERKDAQFKGTGAVLRGAAIGLLPINFMAIALLAGDEAVTGKSLVVPLMGLVYLAVWGWGLRRWCSSVHPGLGFLLGGTLLFLNFLVTLAPLTGALGGVKADRLLPVVGTGFYLGFFALSASVVRFTRKILTAELAKEKRVVWFFGATLAVTFVQVFAWVHGSLKHLPQVHTYAPMVVLTGWLVLYMERRTLDLRGEAGKHGAESFLGFAFILLGVLMGIGDPVLRIVTLVLAGVVWVYQSLPRKQALHYWIGLTFVTLGGAAVGLLPGFPPVWLPTLGIGLAVGLGLLTSLTRSQELLSKAAAGMQAAALILTALVTVLAQHRFGSPPLIAAAHLAAVSVLFGVRGWRDREIRWVQTAMVILALALPYLAGLDLEGQAYHSTSLVLGLAVLSFLWIGLTLAVKSPLLAGSRSTVLWIYGVMAVACMALRVTLDARAVSDPAWRDVGGPLLMCAALVWASYFSRSLVPSGMAMLIGLVLLPELRERMHAAYPQLAWGTGLGLALTALGLTLGSFVLRRMPALKALGEGDKYLGVTPYPLRRQDFTLFTWPMLASALFLTVKVETWNFLTQVAADGDHFKVSMALLISGVVWLLMAVYHREQRLARGATILGLFWIIVGVALGVGTGKWNVDAAMVALAPALVVQGLYFLFRFVLERKYPWVSELLTKPTVAMLRLGSLLLSVAVTGGLVFGVPLQGSFAALVTFTAVELAWHGLASRNLLYGFALFVVDWASLVTASTGSLYSVSALVPTLGLIIGVQVLHVALEHRKPFYDYLRPLLVPFQASVTLLSWVIGAGVLATMVGQADRTTLELALTVIALMLTARSVNSGPLALLAVLVGYVLLESEALRLLHSGDARMLFLATPWRASFLGFTLAVLGFAGLRISRSTPKVLSGPYPLLPTKFPALPWFFGPALLLAVGVAVYHTALPELRDLRANVTAAYVGAATFGIVAYATGLRGLAHGAGVLLTLGNVHLIRVFLGVRLREYGLTEVHLVCLGVALTLLQGSAVKRIFRKPEFVRLVNESSLAWAGLVLVLLSAVYLVHPNLAEITPFRFGVSGAMSLLAGLYFRRAARHPAPGEERYALGCEGFYHFGVTLALWCAALMVPALRNPITALVALGLPVLYFYARAESGFRRNVETFDRYRRSAATLGFIVLALYGFRGIVQMVIFPEVPFNSSYYHVNSPVIFVLGLILLRLHALGGTSWLAFYGGLAVMAATYFAVTALPGLSPFRFPVPSAWCAIAMAHFYTLASLQRSPLRTAIQRLAAIDAQGWQSLRRPWGVCLLVAAHGLAFWGILDYAHQPLMVAPLIVGAASVLIHQGILRGSKLYSLLAQVEIVAALHVAFLGIPSYLGTPHVVWALLGIWAALVALEPLVTRFHERWDAGAHTGLLAALTLAHVFYHHPGSPAGLWAFAIGMVLAALTPRANRRPQSIGDIATATLLPWCPAWLVWFSQAPEGFGGLLQPWPVLVTTATLFATGGVMLLLKNGGAEEYARVVRLRPRLFDQMVAWLGVTGAAQYRVLLHLTFAVVVFVQAVHWGRAFSPRELVLLEGLYAALAVAWVFEGNARKQMGPFFLMQVCVLGAFIVARQQLLLTRGLWKYEYDVWASLAAFFGFVGLKQILDRQPREILIPLKSTLLALPLFSVTWAALHHLGANTELLVVGLHSAAFAYMGKDDRESPYHLVAIGGFVGFILLLFASTLKLTMVYAYVIPVGLGVLVLLQLFHSKVPLDARNIVRAVTVLAMLASTGWSALLDAQVPLLHNLVLVLLCLAAMALGGFLRIRLYVALGFGALMVDLGVILVKGVGHMERTLRMTVVGSMVLLIGASLVFGAIYYKTHKQEIADRLSRWRLRFAGWE